MGRKLKPDTLRPKLFGGPREGNTEKLRDCRGLMGHSFNLKELKKAEGMIIEFPPSPTGFLEIFHVHEKWSHCKWQLDPNFKGSYDKRPKYSRGYGQIPNWLISCFLIKNQNRLIGLNAETYDLLNRESSVALSEAEYDLAMEWRNTPKMFKIK